MQQLVERLATGLQPQSITQARLGCRYGLSPFHSQPPITGRARARKVASTKLNRLALTEAVKAGDPNCWPEPVHLGDLYRYTL